MGGGFFEKAFVFVPATPRVSPTDKRRARRGWRCVGSSSFMRTFTRRGSATMTHQRRRLLLSGPDRSGPPSCRRSDRGALPLVPRPDRRALWAGRLVV